MRAVPHREDQRRRDAHDAPSAPAALRDGRRRIGAARTTLRSPPPRASRFRRHQCPSAFPSSGRRLLLQSNTSERSGRYWWSVDPRAGPARNRVAVHVDDPRVELTLHVDRCELPIRRNADPLFRALTAVLRAERDRRAVTDVAPGDDGGARLVADAARHGVVPALAPHSVHLGLAPDVQTRLRNGALANRNAAARGIAQLAELDDALRAANVRMLVLKGLPLAARLTDSIAGRKVGDLDLLVDPAALPAAQHVLASLGYQAHPEQGDPVDGVHARAIRWIQKDRAFFRPPGLAVELHWRLSRYTLLSVSFDEVWRDHRVVDMDGVDLRTLGPAHGLLHVAVHGADCSFYRYQWTIDVVRSLRV